MAKRHLTRPTLFAALVLSFGVTQCTTNYTTEYPGPLPKKSPLVNWPEAKANKGISNPIWVTGEMDMGMTRCFGTGDLATESQDENQEPLFKLADGAILKNVILGEPAADGIHCNGSCRLQNVWWERVGEDAATFRGQTGQDVMIVQGGGATGAVDKVFQSNRYGTFIIKDFYVESFGKLFRSCGNCSMQGKRKVIVEDVTAVAAKHSEALVGINTNYGDVAEFRGKTVMFDPWNRTPVCLKYRGNSAGSEPVRIGVGADKKHCLYGPDTVTVLTNWEG